MTIPAISKFASQPISPTQAVGVCLIDFGQWICQPFFWSCEKLAVEILHPQEDRIFPLFQQCVGVFLYTIFGSVTLPAWVVGSCLKMGGAALSGKPFMYKRGLGKESWGPTFSLLSFNACMYESGLPMLLGGVMPASYRIERLANMLQSMDPDFVAIQELSYGPSEQLIKHLKHKYPHFYTNIGNPLAWIQQKTIGPELFIASKAPLVSEPQFIPYSHGAHKLGFLCVETPTCWIINAHFPEDDRALLQVAQEIERLKAATGKPCILAGDLNYRKKIPKELFFDPKDDTPTCTNRLQAKMFGSKEPDPPTELDDFILVDRSSHDDKTLHVEKIELINLPDEDSPWKALSDHKPIFARISKPIYTGKS